MHEAHNDFVVLLDMPARHDLQPRVVATVCDGPSGVGAGALLRVTVAGSAREAGLFDVLPHGVTEDDWFLDVRTASGARDTAPVNGFRAAAHYLWATGLERRGTFVVGSATGARRVTVHSAAGHHAEVTVRHPAPSLVGRGTVTLGGRDVEGWLLDVGSGHLACLHSVADAEPPEPDPRAVVCTAIPGATDADVTVLAASSGEVLRARTHRRGFGEVRSDTGGAIAAAAVAIDQEGREGTTVLVEYPGGRIIVGAGEDAYDVRGASTLVARGDLCRDWWRAQVRS